MVYRASQVTTGKLETLDQMEKMVSLVSKVCRDGQGLRAVLGFLKGLGLVGQSETNLD